MSAHARNTDPTTSHEAAASVVGLPETRARIITILAARGPLTRDQLSEAWRTTYPGSPATDQSIRSRLAELMDDGRVVQVGETRNARGRKVQIVGLPVESALFQLDSD